MPPILGYAIVIAAIAALVYACARYLWNDLKKGGCAGCANCGGGCAGCQSCQSVDTSDLPDLSYLRLDKDAAKK
ncbi:MAG: hypothetical protein IJ221_00865 [Oscillibacter sp.]|nr:hypothetical protein [Oscillibacter sp.]